MRKSKSEIRKIQDKIWELCKKIVRYRDGTTCFTCGKEGLIGSSWQTGHFIPSSVCGAYLRYDLRNLAIQCYRCNIDLSGNGAIFYKKLVEKKGQLFVDQVFLDKETTVKAIDHYKKVLEKYEWLGQNLFKIPRKNLYEIDLDSQCEV